MVDQIKVNGKKGKQTTLIVYIHYGKGSIDQWYFEKYNNSHNNNVYKDFIKIGFLRFLDITHKSY